MFFSDFILPTLYYITLSRFLECAIHLLQRCGWQSVWVHKSGVEPCTPQSCKYQVIHIRTNMSVFYAIKWCIIKVKRILVLWKNTFGIDLKYRKIIFNKSCVKVFNPFPSYLHQNFIPFLLSFTWRKSVNNSNKTLYSHLSNKRGILLADF